MIEIYTDGSCRGNGKENSLGGFGVVSLVPDQSCKTGYRVDYIYNKLVENTTNNRMEISALLEALWAATNLYDDEECIVYCDSAYCVNMFNTWIRNWAANNWNRSKNQPIENLDLVQQLYPYAIKEFPKYSVVKVAGHCDIIGNEIADALATDNQAKLAKIFAENDYGITED